MPVTIYPTKNEAVAWSQDANTPRDSKELLKGSSARHAARATQMIRCSLPSEGIAASTNGLVHSLVTAYSQHHHIKIRPDDVWCAILCQLSFHINAHAEEYREFFVSHTGRKKLEVIEGGTMASVDIGSMAQQLTHKIQDNVKDPHLREWMIPNFTTTTENDQVVASILMMGSMQKYFAYTMTTCCGLPSVELLGTREDWVILETKLDKMTFGEEPIKFAALLRPVLKRFVESFDKPKSRKTIDFWNRVARWDSLGSGGSWLDGWITAFCYWGEEGELIRREKQGTLVLDGQRYHHVDEEEIPSGSAGVPVKFNDNGIEHDTMMLAGSVAIGVERDPRKGVANTIHPVLGWYMYEVEGPVEQEARRAKISALRAELKEYQQEGPKRDWFKAYQTTEQIMELENGMP